jgi:hypothetical protein
LASIFSCGLPFHSLNSVEEWTVRILNPFLSVGF